MPNNGIGSWWVRCRNCGHEHRITNFGRRRAIDPDRGEVVRATVHEAGCMGLRLLHSGDHRWYRLGEQLYPEEAAKPTRAERKKAEREAKKKG